MNRHRKIFQTHNSGRTSYGRALDSTAVPVCDILHIHMAPPPLSSVVVDLWWDGVEAWYNRGEYRRATHVWLRAVAALEEALELLDQEEDDDKAADSLVEALLLSAPKNNGDGEANGNETQLARIPDDDCCDDDGDNDSFGIDRLEDQWRELWTRRTTTSRATTTTAGVETSIGSLGSTFEATTTTNQQPLLQQTKTADSQRDNDDDDMASAVVVAQWLLFVAGCCLDDSRFGSARRCLLLALRILLLLLLPIDTPTPHSTTGTTASPRPKPPRNTSPMSAVVVGDLVAAILQEYMASYQELQLIQHQQPTARKDAKKNTTGIHTAIAAANGPCLVAQRRVVALTLSSSDKDDFPITTTPSLVLPWTNVYHRPAFFYPCSIGSNSSSSYPTLSSDSHGCSLVPPLLAATTSRSVAPTAVYPRNEHPSWCSDLEDHWETIQAEFEQLLTTAMRVPHPTPLSTLERKHDNNNNNAQVPVPVPVHWPRVGAGDHRDGAGEHDGTVVCSLEHDQTESSGNDNKTTGDWREIVLMGASGARPELAPNTVQLIRRYCADDAVSLAESGAGEVIFSVIAGNTHIQPHTASHNLRLTAHLGLRIPSIVSTDASSQDCYIRVGDQKCRWEAGKMLVFDDSFEHEVVNSTPYIRGVLLLRFWHPSIPIRERQQAVDHILSAKQNDRLRRCNPPAPPPVSVCGSSTSRNSGANAAICHNADAAMERGMNRGDCTQCGRGGFESIRITKCYNEQDRALHRMFVCECGQAIS